MPRNKKQACSIFYIAFFVTNYVFPRVFGLFAMSVNLTTYRFSVSRGWNLYSILIGTIFLYNYPTAILQIIYNQKTTINITDLAELFQYGATYLLTAAIYFRNITVNQNIVDYVNKGADLYDESQSLTTENVGTKNLVLQYIGRAYYSYIGHTVLNFYRLTHKLKTSTEDVSLLYKLLYFLPDIAITSVTMRFCTAVMIPTFVVRRVNVTLERTIRQINQQKNQTTFKRSKIYLSSMKRIEIAMAYTVKVFETIRNIERMMGAFIVFLIGNAMLNLTNQVC